MDLQSTLQKVIRSLDQPSDRQQPTNVSNVHNLINLIDRCTLSHAAFEESIPKLRTIYYSSDSTKRGLILRTIRLCIEGPQYVKTVVAEEIHWLVVESLERDGDHTMERIQAIKFMDKVRTVDAEHFPAAFGRSIIAIANSKDDPFRKICIESLRELAIANPSLLASLYGFATLIDAVLEPITQDLADNVTITLLYLLNDPNTRQVNYICIISNYLYLFYKLIERLWSHVSIYEFW
jgi:hypothetical protein